MLTSFALCGSFVFVPNTPMTLMDQARSSLTEQEDEDISQRISSLSLEPNAPPVLVPFTAADITAWKEFVANKQKIKSWDTWREQDWNKHHPPHIHHYFEYPPVLETPRLLLRLLRESDTDAVFRVLSDETTTKYYGTAAHKDVEYTRKQYVDLMIARFKYRDCIPFVITLKGNDDYIGHVNANSFSREFKFVELAYVVDPVHQRKGIATEAVGRVVAFLQDDLKIHKIRTGVYANNVASKKVLEKLGFKAEGYLRDNEIVNGEFMDEYPMALLAGERKEYKENRE